MNKINFHMVHLEQLMMPLLSCAPFTCHKLGLSLYFNQTNQTISNHLKASFPKNGAPPKEIPPLKGTTMSLEQYQDFSPSSVMDSPTAMTTAPSNGFGK